MSNTDWNKIEYENLRSELNGRITFLHQTISLAVIFWLIFLVVTVLLIVLEIEKNLLYTYLLSIPIVFDLIAFNYQSNQNSLESIPRYIHQQLKPQIEKTTRHPVLDWEEFFAKDKEPFKAESYTKVFPFVLPSLIPFYFLIAKIPLLEYQTAIVIVDIALLVLMLENFRYKLRRVKIVKSSRN